MSTTNIGTIHVIRHAQGIHNIGNDKTILDPELSLKGLQQARELHDTFPYKQNVGIILTSPLRRTLQTTIEGFSDIIDRAAFLHGKSINGIENGVPLVLDPDLQAHSARPCDTGTDIASLQEFFHEVSFGKLDKDWHIKEGVYASDEESLHKRARHVRRRLTEQFSELAKHSKDCNNYRRDIVIVSHGGFLTLLMQDKGFVVPEAKWKTFSVLLSPDDEITFEEHNN
jgi:broad specificity phosphatase PhoE